MSLNVDEYVRVGVEERIPEATKILSQGKSAQSIIVSRSRVRQTSMASSSYSPNAEMAFRLTSSAEVLDPQTALLQFKANITADASGCFHDDLASSFFNRVSLYVGGKEIETIQNFDKMFTGLVYSHANPGTYSQAWNYGGWKYAPGQGTTGVATASVADYFRTDVSGVNARYSGNIVSGTTSTFNYSIPLAHIFAMFKTNKFILLPYMQNIEIRILLNSNNRALYSQLSTSGNSTYTISDPVVVYDSVQCNSEYMGLMNQVVMSGQGIEMPLNMLTTYYQTYAGSGVQNLNFTLSTPALLSTLFTFYTVANDSSLTGFSSSGLVDPAADQSDRQYRVNIGGKLYPEYDRLSTTNDVINQNKNSLYLINHTGEQIGLWDKNNFTNATYGTHHLMFNFRKAHHSDDISHDGLNLAMSGSVLVLTANVNAGLAGLMTAEHMKVLIMRNGQLELE